MNKHETINYVEFHSADLAISKAFFTEVFSWEFTDYGDEYTAFTGEGLDGGFFKSDKLAKAENGAPLIVFYSKNLEQTQAKIKLAGGTITQETFDFPGGKRFHFTEPSGNEFAVWSE